MFCVVFILVCISGWISNIFNKRSVIHTKLWKYTFRIYFRFDSRTISMCFYNEIYKAVKINLFCNFSRNVTMERENCSGFKDN